MWLCKCSCGRESIVSSCNLVSGASEKCSYCAHHSDKFKNSFQKRWEKFYKNRSVKIGDVFDRLTVIKETDKRYFRQKLWLCKCSCGNEILTTSIKLKKGMKRSCNCLINDTRIAVGKSRIGSKNPRWRSDLTDRDRRNLSYKFRHLQNNPLLVKWRKSIFARDKFYCQICGKNGGVNAHHLFSWDKYKDKRYDTNNGVTMCKTCHKTFHKEFGWGNNTQEQYDQFKKTRVLIPSNT